jgi:putative DNA primase/helicase
MAGERPPEGSGSAASRDHAVPEAVRRHFVQVDNRYYFSDGALAFTDRTRKLTTPSENTQLIADLVSVAKARGWERIAVSGTERFRREAWLAAQREGLAVTGYRASRFEQAQLVRQLERTRSTRAESNDAAKGAPTRAMSSSPAESRALTGRLVDHGAAPYQQDPHEAMSYFVRVATPRGERTVWGVDLGRAMRESLSQPKAGDDILMRKLGQDTVTVRRPRHDESGREVGVEEKGTHRNRWSIETRQFLEERRRAAQVLRDTSVAPAQGARQQPELLGAYLQVRAAELAAQQFRDRGDRERFVSLVRRAVADAVARGEPIPKPRMQTPERSTTPSDASVKRSAAARERS